MIEEQPFVGINGLSAVEQVIQSRAVARITKLPIVQLGLNQLRSHWENPQQPQLQIFRDLLRQPENQQLAEFLLDAVSHEVFVYGDLGWAEWIALGNRINAALRARGGGRSGMKALGAVLILSLLAAVSVYGGFFNAGLGILLLAFLAMAGMNDMHAMNGLKLFISSTIALVAVARFVLDGTIDWYHGSIALVGVTTGGYVAARLAQYIPTQWIRIGVIVYGIAMTLYFFWTAYGAQG